MTIKELRALLDRVGGDESEITVFGVGPGLPLELTGEWTRAPREGAPLLLHSRVKDEDLQPS